ncbi:M64 family metallopeptidase [Undibacterium cyanobacteriorum]|uniref:M64 family metallopeptidase n=1 Tax=Undibacterium cyanobacteriorum TaxID=3073561 RepID=A0ABY9RIH6_9BURK|nr:M64 family metallopeptidase [Undibacterium sp. 20NA77.5]WMW81005.1 M64 family metallopeptidase [Undibacterium sp. 20NA77.5]
MPDVISLLNSGSSANRVDIVIVAEGYTQAERAKFITDANTFLKTFLGSENARLNAPFSNYQGFFNANALFFASAQSGTDQPNNGTYVNTYFSASQHGSDGRLLYGDSGLVWTEVEKALPSDAHELVIVLVNTPLYGGAGGDLAWASAGNSSASELALHEIGHSFAGLQDEYVDSAVAPSFPLNASAFLNSAHVTDSLSRIPWSAWLGYNDGELGTIGTYQGGYYRANGVWRATINSKMLSLGVPFSAPEKEAFALNYYSAIGDYLSVESSIPGIYRPLTPNNALFSFAWGATGKSTVTTNGSFFDAYAAGLMTGSSSINLTTTDNTGLIRKNLSSTQQKENIAITSTIKQVADLSYTVSSADKSSIVQMNASDNIVSLSSQTAAQNIYLDGGAGTDALKLPLKLADTQHFSVAQMANGTLILGESLGLTMAAHAFESIQFQDFTVNPNIHVNAKGLTKADLKVLEDLYVAYFNRIPEADGLNYWITQYKSGMSLDQIGNAFYPAALYYSDLTGYRENMSSADFINILYKNALGRAEGADPEGLAYWTDKLDSGAASRGTIVRVILASAHSFKGDPTWGWVADLLDNKVAVADQFAVQWGLGYASNEASITNGMKLAQLVTPTDVSAALQLIGIAEGQIQFI